MGLSISPFKAAVLSKIGIGPAEDLGFNMNRPVAALVIFRSCLQWKTFQADRTVLFDKVRSLIACSWA